ncbi:MAG TPA: amidophosphoribosyltransferase [Deltaproteobacteria bacterium]|nr:MAG: amidophosphoribosyltransferase [Deltaproteobacteria bacterium GWA2_45_12]HBF12872.1 amidophosphoribosyltransferase [Deltaproteobacteria bacterium]
MCGIVGIYNHPEASKLAYLGLYALQHRGQESAGIVSNDGGHLIGHIAMGHVADIFTNKILDDLRGELAIGHVRYSTTGASILKNCQPFTINYARGALSVAHNGNIVNAAQIRHEFEAGGAIFQSTIDTEVILHLLAQSKKENIIDRLTEILPRLQGAYSLLFLTETRMVAVRDPHGFRPLVIGKKGDAYVVASETSALDLIEAQYIRSVDPGEIVLFEKGEMKSFKPLPNPAKRAHCIFEYIYFARPDSIVFDRNVYEIRKGFGAQLAKENPIEADMVVPIPDSGVPAAIGYSEVSKIPFEMALVRNHYIGRTFIEPEDSIRHFGVKIKLNAVRELMKGKRVVLIDDSIVRGTTSRKIVKMVRDAGAKEVHMRISSPPTTWPCYYGIDTPTRKELIAASKSVEEIRQFINADSLSYLSTEALYWFEKQKPREWFCDACFTGEYPEGAKFIQQAINFEV